MILTDLLNAFTCFVLQNIFESAPDEVESQKKIL